MDEVEDLSTSAEYSPVSAGYLLLPSFDGGGDPLSDGVLPNPEGVLSPFEAGLGAKSGLLDQVLDGPPDASS